jgi:hypothetical protein
MTKIAKVAVFVGIEHTRDFLVSDSQCRFLVSYILVAIVLAATLNAYCVVVDEEALKNGQVGSCQFY